MNFKLIFSFLYLLNIIQILSMEYSDQPLKFSLPFKIVKTEDIFINLEVNIPKGFKQIKTDSKNSKYFIPEIESENNYSQRIVIQDQGSMKFNNWEDIIQNLYCIDYKHHNSYYTLLEEFKAKRDYYSIAHLAVSYPSDNHQDKRQVLFMKFFFGQYNCISLHYIMTLMDDLSELDALELIKEFEKNNIKLTFNK
ncbi:hypothetical protein M1446_05505 [Candidatus Dependentiae bacterium]|nr:hypothetical protein [Candidatus Dependentiae bacterium]